MHTYTSEEMVKRTVRRVVREHSQSDPLDPATHEPDMTDVCPGTEAPGWLKQWIEMTPQEHLKERLESMREHRLHEMAYGRDQYEVEDPLSVHEILEKKLYTIKGKSKDFDSVHSYKNGILIEVQYSKQGWRAGYEVGPKSYQYPHCWYN